MLSGNGRQSETSLHGHSTGGGGGGGGGGAGGGGGGGWGGRFGPGFGCNAAVREYVIDTVTPRRGR